MLQKIRNSGYSNQCYPAQNPDLFLEPKEILFQVQVAITTAKAVTTI